MFIRGVGGSKNINFVPDDNLYGSTLAKTQILMSANWNTVALQNADLTGLNHVSASASDYLIGAVGLSGDALVNVGDPDNPDEVKETDMVFM